MIKYSLIIVGLFIIFFFSSCSSLDLIAKKRVNDTRYKLYKGFFSGIDYFLLVSKSKNEVVKYQYGFSCAENSLIKSAFSVTVYKNGKLDGQFEGYTSFKDSLYFFNNDTMGYIKSTNNLKEFKIPFTAREMIKSGLSQTNLTCKEKKMEELNALKGLVPSSNLYKF